MVRRIAVQNRAWIFYFQVLLGKAVHLGYSDFGFKGYFGSGLSGYWCIRFTDQPDKANIH